MKSPQKDKLGEELAELLEAGAKPVGLGPNRLRVETAAIAMVTAGMLHWQTVQGKGSHYNTAATSMESESIAA